MSDTEHHQEVELARHDAKVRRQQTVRLVAIGVLAAAFAAVALDNTQDVAVGWVFDEARVPLIVALVGSFLAGAVIGAFARRRRRAAD